MPTVVETAEKLRAAVMHAVAWDEFQRLPSLLKQIARIAPTPSPLAATGIGYLVADRRLWGLADASTQRMAQALTQKWKCAVSKASTVTGHSHRPFGGLRALPFRCSVAVLCRQLNECSTGSLDPIVARRCAVSLVLQGFRSVEHSEGVAPEDVVVLRLAPAELPCCASLYKSQADQEGSKYQLI